MGTDRISFFGARDYTGIDLQTIIKDLDEYFFIEIDNSIKRLENLKKQVEKQRSCLDNPDSIEYTIDYFVILFLGFRDDFKRLKSEMAILVENKHIEIIDQIFERCKYENNHAREFKNEHIVKSLPDESLRPLLDDIYITIGTFVSEYASELRSMQRRLKTFIGTSLSINKNQINIPKTPRIKIPIGTSWHDIQLMFRSTEIIEIKIKGKVSQNSNYEELGFIDKRSITKDKTKTKYNRLWGVLAIYARYNGEIDFKFGGLPYRLKKYQTLKKDNSDLSKHMKDLFSLSNSPFYYSYKSKCYHAKFGISMLNPDIYNDILGFLSWQ